MKPFTEAGELLNWLVNASLQAALLVPVILLVQWLLRHRLSARWRFALWWLLIVRLLLPVSFASPWSIFNYVQPQFRFVEADLPPFASADVEASLSPPAIETTTALADNLEPQVTATGTLLDTNGQESAPEHTTTAISDPTEASGTAATTQPRPSPHALDAKDQLIPLVGGVWLLGAVLLAGVVTVQSVAFSRRLRSTRQRSPALLSPLLADCRGVMGIRREIGLLETEAVTSPVLYGLFGHRILLPWGFADRFSPAELRHVLLHELAHVKRGDLRLNWLATALQIVHWFNPIIWLGFARLRADRELACDELALLRSGADTGRDYGRTMLKLLADFARPKAMPGLVGILEDKQQVQRRVNMIARFKRPSRWSTLAVIPITALGLVLLTDAQVPAIKPVDESAHPTPVIESVSPTTAEATRMILRVLDDETGNPIAGASVQANYFYVGGQMEPHELRSNAEGVANVPVAERVEIVRGMNIFITPAHFVPIVVSWSRRDIPPHEYTVRMKPAMTVGGRVVDEAGQPVSRVQISISSPDASGSAGREHVAFNSQHAAAYTDMEGRWRWPHLPRTMTNFWFALTATNYMATDVYAEVIDDLTKKNGIHGIQTFHLNNVSGLTNLETVIYHGFSLTGRVIDQELKPVAGALVREVHNRNYRYRVQAVTDDRGEFVMRGLKHQPTILVAEAGAFSPASSEIELHVGPNKHTFLLSKGRALKGLVTDPNGTPITNALIRTDTNSQGIRLFNWTARSDAEGRFEWTHAPNGEVLYWIEADGFLPVRDRPLTADGTEHQIILKPRDPPPSASVPGPVFELRLVESEAGNDTETLPVYVQPGKAIPANRRNLFVRKESLLDATAIASVNVETNEFTGRPVINIDFTAGGQAQFAEVTRDHVSRQLAIVIDGQVVSTPVIAEPITGGKAAISGDFTLEAAERLARLINDHLAQKSPGVTPFTGTVQGRVILAGTPPPERIIDMLDEKTRAEHSNAPTTQFYVVADDGGLKDVVVYLQGNLPPPASAADLPPLIIDHQRGFKVPYISAMTVGQTLLLTNSDAQLHNCHIIPSRLSGNREANKAMMRGVASPHAFTAPDHWVRLKCDVHPWEFAYVCVFPHRYFAVTDASGHFSITNVPPGRYTLHAIHRKAKPRSERLLEVQVASSTVSLADLSMIPEAGLQLVCNPDRSRYVVGDEITLRCTITNTSSREQRVIWHPTAGSHLALGTNERTWWQDGRELPYFKPVNLRPPVRIGPRDGDPLSEIILPPHTSVELIHKRMAKTAGSFRWILAYEAAQPSMIFYETLPMLEQNTFFSNTFTYDVVEDAAYKESTANIPVPPPPAEPTYPYTLETSPRAFTRVFRESDDERLKIEFLRWTENPRHTTPDAVIRVVNPGSREVLIWNMRQQVLVTNATGGRKWKDLKSDYPGGGWEKATIPAGGSTVFSMSPSAEGDWRVCLLYSRLVPELAVGEVAFRGDLEAIGPVIKTVNRD